MGSSGESRANLAFFGKRTYLWRAVAITKARSSRSWFSAGETGALPVEAEELDVRVDPQRDVGAVRPDQRRAAVDRDIG